MTEASPVITQTRPADTAEDKAETIGQPLPQAEVAIVDPVSGQTVPCGQVGEMRVRGYQVMKEVLRQAQGDGGDDLRQLAAYRRPVLDGRASLLQGRGPAQGQDHPGWREYLHAGNRGAGLQPPGGRQGRRRGRAGRDVGRAGGSLCPAGRGSAAYRGGVIQACWDQLSPHKTPRIWVIVEEFPLTASGKIQKYVLRDRYQAGELR